jgi:transaldolase
MSTRLLQLHSSEGQSPWLDNLQRGYITSGQLKDLIASGIRGLTSNPTIFQKAIQSSTDYDDQFKKEIASGVDPTEAYWSLVISDIWGALDAFAPIYEESGGTDGFVSVEVDPWLAHKGDDTLTAARSLHKRVSRPNVMIKIPATREGIPAIRQMIAEGRNVNVTLIFSLDRYQDVMHAYIDGLEQRHKEGHDITNIASVASFFISRVDTEIDNRLDAIGSPEALSLRGTAAIAQARLAYRAFCETFSGPRWDALEAAGAQLQRPLWASTSTKNPSYPDTLYVDQLIGPNTVNTLPDATVAAFADHGDVSRTIDVGVDESAHQWSQLEAVGVSVDDVAQLLEREGVSSFQKSFDELLTALRTKASEVTRS